MAEKGFYKKTQPPEGCKDCVYCRRNGLGPGFTDPYCEEHKEVCKDVMDGCVFSSVEIPKGKGEEVKPSKRNYRRISP